MNIFEARSDVLKGIITSELFNDNTHIELVADKVTFSEAPLTWSQALGLPLGLTSVHRRLENSDGG